MAVDEEEGGQGIMSKRALVLAFGLLMIGDIAALAANAPLSIEPRGAEPREDLFATKPRNTPPNAAPVAPPAAAARPAVPPAAGVLTGNPLWAIPLGRLTATREHPLFAPTRLPPPVVAVAKPAPAPVAPSRPIEPEKPQLSLLGTVAGREKMGLFIDAASKTVVLKAGENHKGWILRDVRPRQVELAKGLDSAILALPLPDMRAGAALPATPAVAAAPGTIPGIAAAPAAVYTAKAAGAPPVPTPLAGFGQPPVFRQQPAPPNPFQQGRTP